MPLGFAFLFGALAGGALAWVASPFPRRQENTLWISRPFGIVSALTWLVLAPIVAYFVLFHGDWAYLYLVPWRRVPSAVDLLLTLAASGALPAAFLLSGRLLRAGQLQALIGGLSSLAVIFLVLLIAASGRLAVDTTFAEYKGGFGGQPLLSGALGRGIVLAWIVLSFALYWTVQALRRLQRGASEGEDLNSLPNAGAKP